MEINLEKGISLKIEGELGKYQTLPVDSLIKIAEALQKLVLSIAKFDLPTNESVDLNNFKLELTDFKKGSAIPTFVFTARIQTTTADYSNQRAEVNKKLNAILNISDTGNYVKLKELYPEHIKRNPIVENLYDFTTSFNNSPVYICEKENLQVVYQPKKFKTSIKKKLIIDVIDIKAEQVEQEAFAIIKIITKGDKSTNRIKEIFLPEHHSLSYSPEIINLKDIQYILNYPLRCLFEKEDGYYIINNELLDIIGTGVSQDEAEENFNEEFDYLYKRLNSLKNDKISTRLLNIKNIINSFVKEVV